MSQVDIIDREIFFGNPAISQAQLSPDGAYLSCIKPLNGVKNIFLKLKNDSFEDSFPITEDKRPITGYFWTRDGKYILYSQDKDGDENFCIYRVTVADAAPGNIPVPINITPYDEIVASIERVSKLNHDLMFVGINDRDKSWHDLYQISISTGERTLIYENIDHTSGYVFDLKDQLKLITRHNAAGGLDILNYDKEPEKRRILKTSDINDTLFPLRFLSNGKEVYMVSNQGDGQDLTTLYTYNLETTEEEVVHSDPEEAVDMDDAMFSQMTDELSAVIYNGSEPRIYFLNKELESDFELLKSKFEGYHIGLRSTTADESEWLISAFNDRDPGAVYHFNRKSKEVTFLYHPRPELPIEDLAKVEHITYKSIDGLIIPAYLTTPKDIKAKAAVVLVHGGPWARDYYGYNSYAQFLANRGYYVLQPNFRSSTGFGKKFLNAGNLEWGKKMQDDITAGAGYLTNQRLADSDKIAIMGGSYGGYATLAALAFTPDVFKAGIDIVGPSSLLTLLSAIPPYWEAGRKQLYMRVGNPETEEGLELLHKCSPLFFIDQMKAALMVVQGANDPRVKQAEADQIVAALHERNFPVKYLVAKDEGHGFRDPINNMAMIAEIESFLSAHIGGRFQKDIPDEIAKRLEDMTVNVSEVTS